MKNQVKTEATKTGRSPSYPSINLESAVKVVTETRSFGRKITNAHIAGKGEPSGGGFIRKKAALGHFGLISGRGENLEITDLSESIIYPASDHEKISSMQAAFLQPALFNKLYNETGKNIPIDLEVLGNLLIRQYNILPSVKDGVMSSFIKSGIYVGLIEYNDQKKTSIILKELKEEKEIKVEDKKEDAGSLAPEDIFEDQSKTSNQKLLRIPVALTNGKNAVLFLPEALEEIDVKKLKAQIELHANIYK